MALLPTMDIPSLSLSIPTIQVPKLEVPKQQVPVISISGVTNAAHTAYLSQQRKKARLHPKDLGDLLLGNPVYGTRQLRNILEDNDHSELIGLPIISRLTGLLYTIKERNLDPILEKGLTKGGFEAFINDLESVGSSLDLLANPVKSLFSGTGGGKEGDPLRSMGWKNGEYRTYYNWDISPTDTAADWVVNLALEVVSDPVTWASFFISAAAKPATKAAGELAEDGIKQIAKESGQELSEKAVKQYARKVRKELSEEIVNKKARTTSVVVENLRQRFEQNVKSVEKELAKTPLNSKRYKKLTEFLTQNKNVLTFLDNGDFQDIIKRIASSDEFARYRSLLKAQDFLQTAQNKLVNASRIVAPASMVHVILLKKMKPIVATMWNHVSIKAEQYIFERRAAKQLSDWNNLDKNRMANDFITTGLNISGTRSNVDEFKKFVSEVNINETELAKKAMHIIEETPFNKLTDDYVKAELKKVIMSENPTLKRYLTDPKKVPFNDVATVERITKTVDDLYDKANISNKVSETAANRRVLYLNKKLDDIVDQIANVAYIADSNIRYVEETALKEEALAVASKSPETLYNILNDLRNKVDLKDLKNSLAKLKTVNPEEFNNVVKLLNALGVTEDNSKKLNSLVTLVNKLLKQASSLKEVMEDSFSLDVYGVDFDQPETFNLEYIKNYISNASEIQESINLYDQIQNRISSMDVVTKAQKAKQDELLERLDIIEEDIQRRLTQDINRPDLANKIAEGDFNEVSNILNKTLELNTMLKDYSDLMKRVQTNQDKIKDILQSAKVDALAPIKQTQKEVKKFIKEHTVDVKFVKQDNLFNKDIPEKEDIPWKKVLSDLSNQTNKLLDTVKSGTILDEDRLKIKRDTYAALAGMEQYKDLWPELVNKIDKSSYTFNTTEELINTFALDTNILMHDLKVADSYRDIPRYIEKLFTMEVKTVSDLNEYLSYVDEINKFLNYIYSEGKRIEVNYKRGLTEYYNLKGESVRTYKTLLDLRSDLLSFKTEQRLKNNNLLSLLSGTDTLYSLQLNTYQRDMLKISSYLNAIQSNQKLGADFLNPYSKSRTQIDAIVNKIANDDSNPLNKIFAKNYYDMVDEIDAVCTYVSLNNAVKEDILAGTKFNDALSLAVSNTIHGNKSKQVGDITIGELVAETIATLDSTNEIPRLLNEVDVVGNKIISNVTGEVIYESATELATDTAIVKALKNYVSDELTRLYKTYTSALTIIAKRHNKNMIKYYTMFSSNTINLCNSLGNMYNQVMQKQNILSEQEVKDLLDIVYSFYGDKYRNEALELVDKGVIQSNTEDLNNQFLKEVNDQAVTRDLAATFTKIGELDAEIQDRMTYAHGKYKVDFPNVLISKKEIEALGLDPVTMNLKSEYGNKKFFDPEKLADNMIQADLLRCLNGEDSYIPFFMRFNEIKEGLKIYLQTKRITMIEQEIDLKRETLKQFFKNKILDVSPKNVDQYFDNLKPENILTWDLLQKDKLYSTSTYAEYNELYYNSLQKVNDAFISNAELDRLSPDEIITRNENVLNFYLDVERQKIDKIVTDDTFYDTWIERVPGNQLDMVIEAMQKEVERDISSPNKALEFFKTIKDKNVYQYETLKEAVMNLYNDTTKVSTLESFKGLSESKLKQLKRVGITADTPINGTFRFLMEERNLQKQLSIYNLPPQELRYYIDAVNPEHGYTVLDTIDRVMNVNESKLNPLYQKQLYETNKELSKVGLKIETLQDEEGVAICNIIYRTDDNITKGVYHLNKPSYYLPELQERIDDIVKQNIDYINWNGTEAFQEFYTGVHLNRELQEQMMSKFNLEQKLYSKSIVKDVNKTIAKEWGTPDVIFNLRPETYNKLLNICNVGNNGSEQLAYRSMDLIKQLTSGITQSINLLDKGTKYVELYYTQNDYHLNGELWSAIFKDTSFEEFKQYVDENDLVVWIVRNGKPDDEGNPVPKILRLLINNEKDLQEAIAADALITSKNMYASVHMITENKRATSKLVNVWRQVLKPAYGSAYLSNIGQLTRNFIDTCIYKNAAATDGVKGIVKNFKYEIKAAKMYRDYRKIIEQINNSLVGTNDTFNKYAVKKVLDTLPKEQRDLYYFMDLFTNHYSSSGKIEEIDALYRKYNAEVLNNKTEKTAVDVWQGLWMHNPVTKTINNLNDGVENMGRLGLLLRLLDEGHPTAEALKKVADTHFSYSLKDFGQDKLADIFLFVIFPIHNAMFYLNEGLTKNPELYKIFMDMEELSYNSDGITWDDVRHSSYLTYHALTGNIRIGQYIFKTGSSVMDFLNLFSSPVTNIIDRLNPVYSAIYNRDLNELNPFTGQYSRLAQRIKFIKTNGEQGSILPELYAKLNRIGHNYKHYNTYYTKGYSTPKWTKYPKIKKPNNAYRTNYKFYSNKYYFTRPDQLNWLNVNKRRWTINPYWFGSSSYHHAGYYVQRKYGKYTPNANNISRFDRLT